MPMKVVVIGAGGHARTVASILRCYPDIDIDCFIDKEVRFEGEMISGAPVIPVMDNSSILPDLLKKGINSAIISVGDNFQRERHFAQLSTFGFDMINAIHPSARIANDATIGKGVVISTGVIVCTLVSIGDNTIISSGSIIEHEGRLGENVFVSNGVNVAGRVTIGRNSFIGIGSTVIESIAIGENVVVGAGSVVLGDIPDNSVVAGVPAKVIRQRK